MFTQEQENCLSRLYGIRQEFATSLVGWLQEAKEHNLSPEILRCVLDELEQQEQALRALTRDHAKRHNIVPSIKAVDPLR